MRQRIITAIVMIACLIPIFYFKTAQDNNIPLIILGFLITVVATTEVINMKETEAKLPFLVRLTMYLAILFLSFQTILFLEFHFTWVTNLGNVLPYIFIILAILMVVERDFQAKDASFVYFLIVYLGLGLGSLFNLIIYDISIFLYLILITILTDTFAYFTGYFIGKHKLIPRISPKKTVEGAIGGIIAAVIGATFYGYQNLEFNFWVLIILSFGLSIVSQFGDLIASLFKRTFKIKDYGNLFPGHGGVLDRLDSLIFTALVYGYLINFLQDVLNISLM